MLITFILRNSGLIPYWLSAKKSETCRRPARFVSATFCTDLSAKCLRLFCDFSETWSEQDRIWPLFSKFPSTEQ